MSDLRKKCWVRIGCWLRRNRWTVFRNLYLAEKDLAPEVRCDRLLPSGNPVVELAEKACVVVVGVAVETEAVVGIPVAVVEDGLGRKPKGTSDQLLRVRASQPL